MAKSKLSMETKREIKRNLKENVKEIVDDVVLEEEKEKKDIGKFVYLFGIVGPILAVFQAIKIYFGGTAAGVSMIYWGAYLAVAVMWFTYGVSYKDKPIMITYGIWVVVELIILNGIYFYS